MADINKQELLQRLGIPFTGTGCDAVADLSQLGGGTSFNVTTLTPAECEALFDCVAEHGTESTLVEFVERIDFSMLTTEQCRAIFDCILASGVASQFDTLLSRFDFTKLSSAQCQAIFSCILNNATAAQYTTLVSNLDLSELSQQQCRDVFACVLANGTVAQYAEFITNVNFANLTEDQCRDIVSCIISDPQSVTTLINAILPIDAGNVNVVDGPGNYTGANVEQVLQEIAIRLAGIDNNAITNIDVDLQATANPNEFTVVFSWTAGDGNRLTTADATPIVINGDAIDFAALTPAQCQAIFDCINDNGTTEQFNTFINNVDFSELSEEQCQAIFTCILNNATAAQYTTLVTNLDLSELSQQQCRDVFACLLANGTVAQYAEFITNVNFANLTEDQCRDIVSCIISDPQSVTTLINAILPIDAGSVNVVDGSGNYNGANVEQVLQEIALRLAGINSTAITNIDLQATANANEFTVVISWTDGDGNQLTTTDATPIVVSGGAVNFTTLTPVECQAIFDCINNNGTTEQFNTFINNVDFSELSAEQCQSILQCIIDNGSTEQFEELAEKLGVNLEDFDFSDLTDEQCQAIALTLRSTDSDNAMSIGSDGKLSVKQSAQVGTVSVIQS